MAAENGAGTKDTPMMACSQAVRSGGHAENTAQAHSSDAQDPELVFQQGDFTDGLPLGQDEEPLSPNALRGTA